MGKAMNQRGYIRKRLVWDVLRIACFVVLIGVLLGSAVLPAPTWLLDRLGVVPLKTTWDQWERVYEVDGVAAFSPGDPKAKPVAVIHVHAVELDYRYGDLWSKSAYRLLIVVVRPPVVENEAGWERIRASVGSLSIRLAQGVESVPATQGATSFMGERSRIGESLMAIVPGWVVYGGFGAVVLGVLLCWPRWGLARDRLKRGECARCGYGLSATGCSECGLAV